MQLANQEASLPVVKAQSTGNADSNLHFILKYENSLQSVFVENDMWLCHNTTLR